MFPVNQIASLDSEPIKPEPLSDVDKSSSKTFEWSFKPIILWMKIWGIRLDTSSNSLGRAIFLVIGFIALLTNFAINGFSFYTVLDILMSNRTSKIVAYLPANISSATLVNVGMEQSFTISLMVGDHLIFFIVSLTTWRNFWQHLMQIQEQLKLTDKFFHSCRKITFIALLFLVLVINIYPLSTLLL